MKIMYINGYREDDKLSSTYLMLKKEGFNIEPCQWKYGDNVYKKIDDCIKRIKPDLIIASSTGALFATQFNIKSILINPVTEKKDIEKLFNKDFSNYPEKIKNKNVLAVILGTKDEVLDYKKAKKIFDENIIYEIDAKHRIKKEKLLPILKNIIAFEIGSLIL